VKALSYTMLEMLRRIDRAGANGVLDYSGRTMEALKRRKLVESKLPDGKLDALYRWRWYLTDAGRAALK
jgi:hypothetical protein